MPDELDDELDTLFDEDEDTETPPQNNGGNGKPKIPGAVKQVIGKLREDRRQLREENARLKAEKVNPPTPPAPQNEPPKPDTSVEKLTFAQQNKELDWEDVENAFAIAQMKGISRQDALKDPLFVAYKEKKEASRKVNDATPPPSNRSGVVLPEGKRAKDMTDAERREAQERIIQENRRKK